MNEPIEQEVIGAPEEVEVIEFTWTDRVSEDKDALQNKIQSLSEFTSSDEYRILDQNSQLLLQTQLSVMVAYSQLLTLRITSNVQGNYNED